MWGNSKRIIAFARNGELTTARMINLTNSVFIIGCKTEILSKVGNARCRFYEGETQLHVERKLVVRIHQSMLVCKVRCQGAAKV